MLDKKLFRRHWNSSIMESISVIQKHDKTDLTNVKATLELMHAIWVRSGSVPDRWNDGRSPVQTRGGPSICEEADLAPLFACETLSAPPFDLIRSFTHVFVEKDGS